jgi:hypothetical protein
MKNSILPITKNLQELHRLVSNLESQYRENYFSIEHRKIYEDKLNLQLKLLCKNKKEERVTIICESNKFETTIYTIKNCIYKNILCDLVKDGFSSDEKIIYLDFESQYFEVLLEILRFKQNRTEEKDLIKKLDNELIKFKYQNKEIEKQLTYINSNYYNPILQVYDRERIKVSSNLCDSIKKFFYEDWEIILEEFKIIDK